MPFLGETSELFGGFSSASGATYVPAGAIWLDGSADYLTWTPSSGSSNTAFTFSFWTKRAGLGAYGAVLAGTTTAAQSDYIRFGTSNTFETIGDDGNDWTVVTSAVYRDTTAWEHWVVSFNNTTDVRIWNNGVEITSFSTNIESGTMGGWLRATAQYVGRNGAGQSFNGYLAEVIALDGTAVTDALDFGEYDTNGNWVPIDPTTFVTANKGTNGFWLDFADSANLGNDVSGNNNDFTLVSITSANSTSDRPADDATNDLGNYCTGNPLFAKNTANDVNTWTEGNTKIAASSTHNGVAKCSIGIPSNATGKWYFEATPNIGSNVFYVGLAASNYTRYPSSGTQNLEYRSDNGNKVDETNTSSAYGASYTSGDVIGVEYDADTDTLTFYKNGSSQGAAWTDVSNRLAFPIFPYCFINNGSGNTFKFNFGATAWTYAPASVQEISTANLPAPTVTDPTAYFGTLTYTGDTNTPRSITGLADASGTAWTPDLVWIKSRSNDISHYVQDAVRGFGASKELLTDSTAAEGSQGTGNGYIDSVVSGGFSATDGSTNDVYVNENAYTYVAWCMKANGSGSSNTDGTVTSTASVADHSGFAIIKHTNTSGDYTVGHGMGQAPDMLIQKGLGTQGWLVWTAALGVDGYLALHATDAVANPAGDPWSDTSPTSSVFTVAGTTWYGGSSFDIVTYAFAKTPGLIGIGSYTGNASTDGPYVVVNDGGSGFRPAFVIIKLTGTPGTESGGWHMYDNVRGPYAGGNPPKNELFANLSGAEGTPGNSRLDFTANGFKIRDSVDLNESGKAYIYLAFAEYPFGGEGVAQAKAR